MNEKVRKVFDLLGVEPNEEFKICDTNSSLAYRFNENFLLEVKDEDDWNESTYQMADILRGKIKIIKLPTLTGADKNAVRYLRDGGMKYVVRDKDSLLWGFNDRPEKINNCDWASGGKRMYLFKELFQFVKWEDEEPFCIEYLEGERNG